MTKEELLKRLKILVIAAPMFIVSQVDLVQECCKNGILGTFPALNNWTSKGLEEWLTQIKANLKSFEETTGTQAAPFGMNLIVHQSNKRLEADLEIAIRQEVPVIITSLGAVPEVVEKVHAYGGLVFHDVINLRHAEKAIEAGEGVLSKMPQKKLNTFLSIPLLNNFIRKKLKAALGLEKARICGSPTQVMFLTYSNSFEEQTELEKEEIATQLTGDNG